MNSRSKLREANRNVCIGLGFGAHLEIQDHFGYTDA